MAKPNRIVRRLTQRLTRGKKPKAWPGGIRVTRQYKSRVGILKARRTGKKPETSKYQKRQLRTYATVDQAKGPGIYGRTDVYETLHRLGEFRRGEEYQIADFAAGVGLVGSKVSGLAALEGAKPKVTFFDVTAKTEKIAENMQKEAPGVLFGVRKSDFRKINSADNEFDRSYCRFAIKNMQPDQQNQALREICRVTKHGGVFVLNDMLSPSGLQQFLNAERRAKNSSGGNPNATHHVPTEKEWAQKLRKAGFAVEKIEFTTSVVHTGDWVSSGQVTAKGLKSYYQFLRGAQKKFPGAWEQFQIKWVQNHPKGPGFEIVYPVVYIKCRKP